MSKQKFERKKPHCNVGTIGTWITEDDVDGGDHEGVGEDGGGRSYRSIRSTRRRRSGSEDHDRTAHVEYDEEPPLRARGLSGVRGLRRT
jgi:hypothetical protein